MTPPGWLPDPQNPNRLRWWDGSVWTAATRHHGASAGHQAFVAIGIVVALLVLGIFLASYKQDRSASDAPSVARSKAVVAADDADVVTMNDYSRIHEGMSYADVVGVIKVSGTEVSRSGSDGIELVVYVWKNERGRGSLSAVFQNDRLKNKTQFGLR